MATLGNIIWFILGGFVHLLFSLVLALVFAITIVGLPIAKALLEYVKIAAFPFGKSIITVSELKGNENVSVFSKIISVLLNIIWFPFGLIGAISCFSVGISCFISIIFIPFGIAYFRIGKYIFLPFGKRVVSKDQVGTNIPANEIKDKNEIKYSIFKYIIGGCALVMCSLFFVLPIVGYEEYRGNTISETATALDFFIGNGGVLHLPVIIILLLFPLILSSVALDNKSFKKISIASILCVIIQIIYYIVFNLLKSDTDKLLTSNWIVLSVYVALCTFSIICIKYDK